MTIKLKPLIVVAGKGTLLFLQTGKAHIILQIHSVLLERFPLAFTIYGYWGP